MRAPLRPCRERAGPESGMSDFLTVILIALLPAAGNLLGAAIAELMRAPRWVIGAALHAAAGVAIALVSVELMPRVLETTAAWLLVLLFAVGAIFSLLLSRLARWLCRLASGGSAGAWAVYTATAADLLSDGLMTGAGSAVSASLGLLLALSQVIANLPAGFATIANFRSQQVARPVRLLAAASFLLPVFVGAVLGFLLLRGQGAAVQNASLAVIVGVLLVATIEDLVPQADKPGTKRWISTTSFVAGFAFFALLSTYLG